jgi:proteasome lid subunit RPN8/RPN11
MSPQRVEWSREERRRAWAAADAALPEECCGILLGRRRGDRTQVRRAVPVANARPGGRETGYEIDPRDLLAAQRRGRRHGLEIVGFVHSHPDGGRRPSRADVAAAWPEASYVVLTRDGATWSATSWRLGADGRMAAERLHETGAGGEGA